jgi:putative peptidoglycan lipid II flippase
MLRGILTVGGWTMASRLLGFLRDMLIAALAGTGPVADAFFVALRLPNLFRRLFGEGAFNAAFVPEFSGVLATEGPAPARRFADEAFGVMVFWLGLLTALGEVFMPGVMAVLAPGFARDPAKAELVVELSRITFPYLFLICLAALVSGVLNGLDRFAAAAAAPVLFNVVSIAAMLFLRPYVPTVGHALSWGVSVSGALQLALLLVAAKRAGMGLHVPRPRLTPAMRRLFARMAPGLVGAGVTQLNLAVDTIIVSWLPPGSASLLNYADRVNQLPLGVIGTAMGTALLPLLSRQARSGQGAAAQATLNRAVELCFSLTLPAAFALGAAGGPIMLVLFSRGAFTPAAARLAAQSLAAYALGLPAFVLLKVLVPMFFAHGDTRTPMWVGFGAISLNLALNLVFMVPLRHVGPALATTCSSTVNAVVLTALLARRGWFRADAQLRQRLPRLGAASLAMAGVLVALDRSVFAPLATSPGWRWAGLALLVAAGGATYAAVAMALGALRPREMLAGLKRGG